jgi:polyisoprenyl-phosphate glycosyltransferase
MHSTKDLELSVIVPVFNSADILPQTISQTIGEIEKLGISYEIILINDGSPDSSWMVMKELKERYPQLVIIDLLKNYGQHSAVFCGIKHSQGKYIITMDDDLQNPPHEIEKLILKIKEGYDLVFAEFKSKQHSSYRKIGTKIINALNRQIFNKPKHIKLTNFRIFTKEVGLRVSNYKTYYPYIPGLLLLNASSMANVLTEHKPRLSGKSNYSLIKILTLVFRILFNYSTYPLNLALITGSIISVISFMLSIYFVLRALLIGTNVQGWTTVVVLISFFNGFMLIIFGIIGQYIVRMMNQMAQPESFLIREMN